MKDPEIQNYSFKERKETLSRRIDAHTKFAKREINDWILEILKLKAGDTILDVGCGSGKQAIPYKKSVGERGIVIATDISNELIESAKKKADEAEVEIQFILHDANLPFNFPSGYFDVISCCFAIYYIKNIEEIIVEFKRLLKPGGRIFLAGPTPENAKLLRTLHQEITKKPLPYMPGVSRFMSEVLSFVQKHFKNVKILTFENPMVFQDIKSYLEYYLSTGLFINSTEDDIERTKFKEEMKIKAQDIIQKEGELIIKKVVGGIFAYK